MISVLFLVIIQVSDVNKNGSSTKLQQNHKNIKNRWRSWEELFQHKLSEILINVLLSHPEFEYIYINKVRVGG